MTESSMPVVALFAVLDGASESDVRQRCVALLDANVSEHGGDLVKRLADGVMAAFRSPADAVSCAIAMQSTLRDQDAGGDVGLRVGLSLGEAFVEEGDYFGTPVVVARRLCDRAETGQILCATLISRIESVRARAAFRSLGPLELKGIATPVLASEVLERE